MRRILKTVAASFAAALLLSGCSTIKNIVDPTFPGEAQYRALVSQLNGPPIGESATIDLKALPGTWTRALLYCDGNSQASIDDALGFHWKAPALKADFYGVIVFATSTKVLDYYVAGSDADYNFTDVPKVYFCPEGAPLAAESPDLAAHRLAKPIVLSRQSATATFEPDPSLGRSYWYLTPAELDRLGS